MTEIEQRIAVAEFCAWHLQPSVCVGGWNIHHGTTKIGSFWFNLEKAPTLLDCIEGIPDYLHDLNAMHDAEDSPKLDGIRSEYVHQLGIVVIGVGEPIQWITVHASAAQRAEALLRTVGKWKD